MLQNSGDHSSIPPQEGWQASPLEHGVEAFSEECSALSGLQDLPSIPTLSNALSVHLYIPRAMSSGLICLHVVGLIQEVTVLQ